MAKIQFSIRALLYVTFLFAVTVWCVRLVVGLSGRMDHTGYMLIAVACVIGPPSMALLGFAIGSESKFPWTGTIVGTMLGIVLFTLLIMAFTQALH